MHEVNRQHDEMQHKIKYYNTIKYKKQHISVRINLFNLLVTINQSINQSRYQSSKPIYYHLFLCCKQVNIIHIVPNIDEIAIVHPK